jgi:3-oxoacyl-[acyl-carrier-protein] synthase III
VIGIRSIGTYLPTFSIDNLSRAHEFETNPDFIREKIGFESLSRKASNEETSDLCVQAFQDLQIQTGINTDLIDCIIVCTQNPDGRGLPHTSAILQSKLHCTERIAAFDISLGCSGFVYGISILESFMAANGLKNGLLFTADPYSKVLNPGDRNTELLFGDAATCTWMTGETPRYLIMKSHFATDGCGGDAITVDKTSSLLSMKGRDVFTFTMKKVPLQIIECLRDNQLTQEQVDLFLLHQGSKYIVDNLARNLGLPPSKVPFNAREIGNTVSSSIPLLLRDYFDKEYTYILLSGFGVGLSWATTILKNKEMIGG